MIFNFLRSKHTETERERTMEIMLSVAVKWRNRDILSEQYISVQLSAIRAQRERAENRIIIPGIKLPEEMKGMSLN